MSNVIALNALPRRDTLTERLPALIDCFARQRRVKDDVYWLKENAELLNILECTGQQVPSSALDAHAEFYADLPARLAFFPQYYRFLLSIGLDLEDLGLPGSQMEALCANVANQGLPEAELSDLQRAEARRLLARRGSVTRPDAGLDDRLRAFINRPATFALPNKKAAYELTHIVFYLSEYGRLDPKLDPEALISLEYVGILAHLDRNLDLLAEVCIALRQAGQVPLPIWEDAVRHGLRAFRVAEAQDTGLSDAYHEYLVCTWAVSSMGHLDRGAAVPAGRCVFTRHTQDDGALRPLSAALMSLGHARSGDWGAMQGSVYAMLNDDAATLLFDTATASENFASFFQGFARASAVHA
ncbi:MAG: hypothetical protein ABJF86_14050 [Tateyamaria sp.]|uniref:DUF6902 family protein n=1 Tax=Tateyamaria sp. TaxID=1929288 RepID=UPI00327945C4